MRQYCRVVFVFTLLLPSILSEGCGFRNCPKTIGIGLNIHMIAHSEMSGGFSETSDQVYESYASKIYTNVLDALAKNSSRKFTVTHVSHFAHWFTQQPLRKQIIVYSLVQREQLTFVGGSWTEPDDSVTHYSQIIDDMTVGQEWMRKRFRACGTSHISWQYTPMSHTMGFASLISQMYDMMFMFKIDKSEHETRQQTQKLEFMWKTGGDQVLVTVPFGITTLPQQFTFDNSYYPISQEELDAGATRDFVHYVQKVARSYATNHVYVLMGRDFGFRNAEINFHSIENLMEAVEIFSNTSSSRLPINIFYSSPNCYMKALVESGNVWSSYADGFVSNSEAAAKDTLMTGYFSSRSKLKHLIRRSSSYVESEKILSVIAGKNRDRRDPLVRQLQYLVLQGLQSKFIGGIVSQEVSDNLTEILSKSLEESMKSFTETFSNLVDGQMASGATEWKVLDTDARNGIDPVAGVVCNLYTDESQRERQISIFNPLSRIVVRNIRLPVDVVPPADPNFIVTNWQGYDLQSQLVPVHPGFWNNASCSQTSHELVFKAVLPAIGLTSFTIRRVNEQRLKYPSPSKDLILDSYICNDFYQLHYDLRTGSVNSLVLLTLNQTVTLSIKWIEYESGDKSNHYTMDTKMKPGTSLSDGSKLLKVVRGPVVEEIHCVISPVVSHVIRLYRDKEEIDIDWIITPATDIPGTGTELFLRVTAEPLVNNYFMTDANCKDPIKRSIPIQSSESAPALTPTESEQIASNLYPVNCFIAVTDGNTSLAVLPDRPQAGTSIVPGTIDLLVHRTTSVIPPGSLVHEVLFDNRTFTGSHRILISSRAQVTKQISSESKAVLKSPIIFVGQDSENEQSVDKIEYSCINKSGIPAEVNILSLENWDERKILVRVEHIDFYGAGNDVTFFLKNVFTCLTITNAREVTLTASRDYEEARSKRVKWKMVDDDSDLLQDHHVISGGTTEVVLRAGEIRCFILSVQDV